LRFSSGTRPLFLLHLKFTLYCMYEWYITIIIAFHAVVQFPEHHITYCGVFQEHVHCFATLEVLLYLCRWNWLFRRNLLASRCILSTWITSAGAVRSAVVAPIANVLHKLIITPSIILYLGISFLVFQGHLQMASRLRTNSHCRYPDGLEKYSLSILNCLLLTAPHRECDCCCGHHSWNKVKSYTANIIQ
jgi:hypothetical protein